MTTTHTRPATGTVSRLLALIQSGQGSEAADLYAPGAVLDATVPGWRFQKHGAARICEVWSHWFDVPSELPELAHTPVPGGDVVRYLATGVDKEGRSFSVHHCHVLALDESGLIARHEVWCGGRWYADRLQEMAEAQQKEPVD